MAATPFGEWMRQQRVKGLSATREPLSLYGGSEPLNPARSPVNGVGFIPLIPALIIGGSALAAGLFGGYQLGAPDVDASGKPIPGPLAQAGQEVGKGVGNAITLGVIAWIGYQIYKGERRR